MHTGSPALFRRQRVVVFVLGWARYKGGISMLKETFSRGGVASGKKLIPAVGAVHASSPIASRCRRGPPGLGSGGGAKMRIDFE